MVVGTCQTTEIPAAFASCISLTSCLMPASWTGTVEWRLSHSPPPTTTASGAAGCARTSARRAAWSDASGAHRNSSRTPASSLVMSVCRSSEELYAPAPRSPSTRQSAKYMFRVRLSPTNITCPPASAARTLFADRGTKRHRLSSGTCQPHAESPPQAARSPPTPYSTRATPRWNSLHAFSGIHCPSLATLPHAAGRGATFPAPASAAV
mmetsp:Transcript_49978/g.97809  ORF Transcript_49978/g.97809 Transcript_49978/m.97809 type:complete len:209 (-) Transcript_49978:513-1139(-)